MFCSNCGRQIFSESRFCTFCGAVVPSLYQNIPVSNANICSYTREEQLSIVGLAMTLETIVAVETRKIDELRLQSYGEFKVSPEKPVIPRKNYSTKEADIRRFEKEMENYQLALVDWQKEYELWEKERDEWNKERETWKQAQRMKRDFFLNDIHENKKAVNLLHANTKLIPLSYRRLETLSWLYDDMSTSGHDIERAIDLYNSNRMTEEIINLRYSVDGVRSVLAEGFTGLFAGIMLGNTLQAQMLSNQSKIIANQFEMISNQRGIMSNQIEANNNQEEALYTLEKIRRSAKTGNFLSVGTIIQNIRNHRYLS